MDSKLILLLLFLIKNATSARSSFPNAPHADEDSRLYYFTHLSEVLSSRNYSAVIPEFSLPVHVKSQVYIESVREIASQCTIDLYLRETWVDVRLKEWHDESVDFKMMYPKLVNEQTKILWKPDSYFFKVSQILQSFGEI